MRSVNRTLRDVKLRCFPSLQSTRHHHHHHSPLSLPSRPTYRRHDAPLIPWRRCLATAAQPGTLSLAELEPSSTEIDTPTSTRLNANNTSSPLQQSASFGKWQWLSLKPDRLAIESDFFRNGPARKWNLPLLVDILENQNDFELWYCLLDHLQRHQGDDGVYRLWNGMWGRKTLYKADTTSSLVFWQTILETALRHSNEQFLDNILVYAEWMKQIHNTAWPNLYTGVVSHYLGTHQHEKALKWHLRLASSFRPSSSDFTAMIKHFCTDEVLNASGTLPRLYTLSHERRMYDSVVPHLYAHGCSRLARLWHKTCMRVGDRPTLYAPTRPFLRYVAGYYPQSMAQWSDEDLAAMNSLDQHNSKQQVDDTMDDEFEQLEVSREFMNRVHGSTFGFTSKSYNDKLGARWFASSWVSVDTAISVVSALGIQQIGPLSLQSIALREATPEGVLKRIGQLQDLGISLPKSNYVKSIQYLARTGDTELLLDLLQCDLHPEVFDDIALHSKLMDSSRASGDLRTYTLLLATRLATFSSSSYAFANTMLEASLAMRDHWNLIRILSDMHHWKISLEPHYARMLLNLMKINAPLHPSDLHPSDGESLRRPGKLMPPEDARFCKELLWVLLQMDIPIPVYVSQQLIFSLGRQGKMQFLLPIVRDFINYYTKGSGARPGFMPVSIMDLPKAMARPLRGVPNLLGVYIPTDTPASNRKHPLSKIFTPKIVSSLIRWAFRKIPDGDITVPLLQLQKRPSPGLEFIRVLTVVRTLRDVGVDVKEESVQKAIILRLAELYGSVEPIRRRTKEARRRNRLSLAQVKDLCDQTWGGPLLPDLETLQQRIRKLDAYNETWNEQVWMSVEQRIEKKAIFKRKISSPS